MGFSPFFKDLFSGLSAAPVVPFKPHVENSVIQENNVIKASSRYLRPYHAICWCDLAVFC